MKITDIAQIATVQKAAQADKPQASGQSVAADKVQAGQSAQVADAVQAAQAAAEASRTARLQQLKQMVSAGGYQPDPQRIADQILNAAQIDAALRGLIH